MSSRKSNIELLRIIAMLMIVLLHANFYTLGFPCRDEILAAPFASFWRILAEQLCVAGVNIFILISGWFGIRPSLKGLCSLLYQVLFWGVVLVLCGLILDLDFSVKAIAKVFWFGSYYWFIIAYVGLYVLSPVINAYVEKASSRQFLSVLVSFFAAEFIYGWAVSSESYNMGYSIVSFIGLYLLGRFLHLHSVKLKSLKVTVDIIFFLLLSIIPATVSWIGTKYGWPSFNPIYYSSPFVVGSAMFLFLAFTKKDFNNKVINWIAASAFSVYLIHLHPVVEPWFRAAILDLAYRFSTFPFTCIVVPLSIVLLLVCTLSDKLRVGSWKMLCSLFFDKTDR